RSGRTAEAAVQRIRDETRSRMLQIADPYLRERLFDLEDLGNRLQRYLMGQPPDLDTAALPGEFILIARSMGPAELLDYAHRRIRGLVLEEGSPTAHVAIVARAFDIPVVGRVTDAVERIDNGDTVIVDGDHGEEMIRPSRDIEPGVAAPITPRRNWRD